MKLLRQLAIALPLALSAGLPAHAQDTATSLSDRVAALYANPDRNDFELGMVMGLHALEKVAQVQWRMGGSSGMIPMLPRFGAVNRSPQAMTPKEVTTTMNALIAEMAGVRGVLDKAEAAGVQPFLLDPDSVWIDMNANGTPDKGEELTRVLIQLSGSRRFASRNAELPDFPAIRFDAADLYWLRAYTHMIEGGAHVGLAFDPAPVLAGLVEARKTLIDLPEKPYPWSIAELDAEEAALKAKLSLLDAEYTELRARIAPLTKQQREINRLPRDATTEQRNAASARAKAFYEANIKDLNAQSGDLSRAKSALSRELRAVKEKRPPSPRDMTQRDKMLLEMGRADLINDRGEVRGSFEPIVDAIYILLKTLEQQPDAAHLQAARDNWLRMIAVNRQFWLAVEAETDDDAEWIPNARQTSIFGLDTDPEAAAAWMRVLRDAEAVLQGQLLIPHPMLPKGTGIDLAAFIDNPAPLDFIGWVQGTAAYPYTAKGPRITRQYWQQFSRLTNGRATMFMFYYN